MSGPHRLSITPTGRGYRGYRVEVDGTDIADAVQALTVEMNGGRPVTAELDLGFVEIARFDSPDAEILFAQDSHDALVHLGWTPPGHIVTAEDVPAGVVEAYELASVSAECGGATPWEATCAGVAAALTAAHRRTGASDE